MSEPSLDRVVQMATELGFDQMVVAEDEVRITLPMEQAQPVDVFVRPCGEMHGKEVLEFSSAGLRLPKHDAGKMPLLILALQRNADVLFGHWGLDEQGSTLRVFHSQITETMDLPEFRGAVLAVADEYSRLAEAFHEIVDRSA